MKENYERSQLIFVLFPSVIGLLVCMMIRTIPEYVGTDCTNRVRAHSREKEFGDYPSIRNQNY